MVERIIHPQWRDQNKDSRYPFADSATLTAATGQAFDIDTLLDAQLYPIGNTANLHLASIVVDVPNVTINIGTSANLELCSVTFDAFNPPEMLELTDVWGRPAGVLVSDTLRLARFRSWNPGTHTFNFDATEFAASVSVPTPELGLRGFLTEDGDILTEDVWIIGENGVVVREDSTAIAGCRVIRVDVVGDPLFRRALCEGTISTPIGEQPLFENKSFLKTINGIGPDEYGDFKITTGSVKEPKNILRVIPTQEGLVFEAVGELSRK